MLKFLFYLILFWFLFRVIRRLTAMWLVNKVNRHFASGPAQRPRTIDEIEEASYTEIDESKP